ncbi:MAG: hypothetical protein DMF03_12785 [Verrucomicrobia bacterium]|nr:MAG: hypothetical protein DMF03_12785 [Verrucomicrobiota bacterium]
MLLLRRNVKSSSVRFLDMKPMSNPFPIVSALSKTSLMRLAIISSRAVRSRFKANPLIPWFGLVALGLAVCIAIPALAGSGGFNNTGSMNVPRVNHTTTRLADGEVLVAGGSNRTSGYLASAELYNPATGKWTLTGSMTIARDGHEAVLLPNGQVLVAGGFDPNTCCTAPPLASAELYNPATGTWTATGSMTTGRESFALTLLSNGKVLTAGGFNNGALSSAELWRRQSVPSLNSHLDRHQLTYCWRRHTDCAAPKWKRLDCCQHTRRQHL